MLVSALAMLAFASQASAAPTATPPTSQPFGCRASLLRLAFGNTTAAEPSVANPKETPCVTDSKAVSTLGVPAQQANTPAPITAGPAGAFTFGVFDPSFKTAPGAAAVASVSAINIPTSAGTLHIVGPVQASASYACVNDHLVQNGQSNLRVISINGVDHPIPPDKYYKLDLGVIEIEANKTIQTPNSLTEQVLNVHLLGSIDLVVGEAQVTHASATPCAGTKGTPPVLEICPKGTTLDAVIQYCVIRIGGKLIIVSRPFRGPSGGTVYALSVARKMVHSPCLYGKGPNWALIAKKRGARVEGTLYSDRIIAEGAYERVAGLGGNDCLDGRSHNQKLYDGNGKERVYGTSHSRIAIGSGNSLIVGRKGHNTISLGNGKTTIRTYGGHNRINAGLGRKRIFAGPGPNRVYTPSTTALVNCGSGGHNTAFLRKKAIPYARAHGCNRIIHLV